MGRKGYWNHAQLRKSILNRLSAAGEDLVKSTIPLR